MNQTIKVKLSILDSTTCRSRELASSEMKASNWP